jgi:nitroreductase
MSNNDIIDRVNVVKQSLVRRRSVRTFKSDPISAEVLDDLIEAAKYAPSGSNWQNQRFLVVTDPEEIQRIGEIRFVWPYKANVAKIRQTHSAGILGHGAALILVFADASKNDARGNGEYHIWESLEIQNCSASIQNILTMAAAYGLGSCWVSASDKMNYSRMLSGKTWREALCLYDIPDYYKMQGVVVLGYPKGYDEEGYAKGEKMHGATTWVSTVRDDNEHYLVKKRKGSDLVAEDILTKSETRLVRFYSKVIKGLLRIVRHVDRKIHKIEYDRYLKKSD